MFVLKTKLKLNQKAKKKNKNPNEQFLYYIGNHLKNIKNTL